VVELHIPVMEKEVIGYLNCRPDGIYVDATLGDGGHAEAILRVLSAEGRLIGIDWDEAALERADMRLKNYKNRFIPIHADYTNLEEVLREAGYPRADGILIDLGASTLQLMDAERGFSFHHEGGILIDLGASTLQLMDAERGFSFHHEGDLDMRMDRRRSLTAKDIINRYTAEQLSEIFFRLGEERFSRRIAARIVSEREQKGEIENSRKLAEIVKEAVPARFRRKGGHPARRIFQSLRLAVNHELTNIAAVLPQAVNCLFRGGRLSVIAYHSLEDRLVKHFLREKSGHCSCPPNMPCICRENAELKVLTSKAVRPSEEEINSNPRARSARLRAAEKIATEEKERR